MSARESLAKEPPPAEAVWTFVNHFWDESLTGGKICSSRFVDLRHAGILSLVVVYDEGRPGCDRLTVFDKDPSGVEAYDYNGAVGGGGLGYRDDNAVVSDINRDGHFELVAPLGGASYSGQDWPSIYAWTGAGYTNVSSHYPKYYRNWLASLKKEIAVLEKNRKELLAGTPAASARQGTKVALQYQSGPGPAPTAWPMQPAQPEPAPTVAPEAEAASRHEIDEKRALASKIERFLGTKDAGMADAIHWANSDDPLERKLAAQVFAEMATPDALDYERTLSRDADHDVALFAGYRLKQRGKEDPYEAPPFERRTPDKP